MAYAQVSKGYGIKSIDFTSAKGKKKKLDEAMEGINSSASSESVSSSASRVPNNCSDEEISAFYKELSETCHTFLNSRTFQQLHSYIPKTSLPEFPQPLLMLFYDQNFFKLSYSELLQRCESDCYCTNGSVCGKRV